MDPRTHARYLSYRERHVYFGRGADARQLTLAEFAELDAERLRLLAIDRGVRSPEEQALLGRIVTLMHLD